MYMYVFAELKNVHVHSTRMCINMYMYSCKCIIPKKNNSSIHVLCGGDKDADGDNSNGGDGCDDDSGGDDGGSLLFQSCIYMCKVLHNQGKLFTN